MSFSKGIPAGTKLDESKGQFDAYRGNDAICECMYPSCHNRKIERNQDAVFWNGVHIPKEEFEHNLSPIAKLAAVANPREEQFRHYFVTMSLHVECAAEWGMHLIKDGLQSHNVGTKLRSERNDAIRKQTKTLQKRI
jgi:hypothetical protein